MSHIIDVFENLLMYNNKDVFIILDINNDIWFKMKDVLKILGYYNITKINRVKGLDKKNATKFKYIKVGSSIALPLNSQPNAVFINEAGLYQLLSNSSKTIAIKFRDELFTEILPSIRKTGIYKLKSKDNKKLRKMNKKLKEEINYYEDKHLYKPTNNSYIYILKKNIGTKKCYKIGYTDDIEKRIQVYKTGKADIELIYYIAINFDGKQTEDCVKNTNRLHRLKNKTDDLCFLTLKQLKNSIMFCLDKFIDHICNCNYCKKKLKISKIDTHICNK